MGFQENDWISSQEMIRVYIKKPPKKPGNQFLVYKLLINLKLKNIWGN